MKKQKRAHIARIGLMLLFSSVSLLAQSSDPGSQVGSGLTTMFTGNLAIGLSLVGIVVAGCMIIFGGGQAVRILGGVLFGTILILDAPKIVTYIQSVI